MKKVSGEITGELKIKVNAMANDNTSDEKIEKWWKRIVEYCEKEFTRMQKDCDEENPAWLEFAFESEGDTLQITNI